MTKSSDYPSKPATSGAPFNPSGKRSVIKSGPDPLSANPTKRNVSIPVAAGRGQAKGVPDPRSNLDYSDATKLPKSARGKPGYDATAKSKPSAKPVAKPTPKPMSTMAKLRADKDFMSTIEKDAAALRKPAQKAAPKAAASKKSSGLSANKSYADYKKLMESM